MPARCRNNATTGPAIPQPIISAFLLDPFIKNPFLLSSQWDDVILCSFLLLILVFNQFRNRSVSFAQEKRLRAAGKVRSLLCRLYGCARRKLEERQPQIAHFDEEAVERCLITDLTGKQRRAIALVRDREVIKP